MTPRGSTLSAYRYNLRREIPALGNEGTVLFCMLNPSTADEKQDDPTIRRCLGFALRWGYARLEVVNLYALRSTDPQGLFGSTDPVGPDNDVAIDRAAGRADEVIVAWGATKHPGGEDHARHVLEILEFHCVTAYCIGQTAALHPRHPLYVKRDVRRRPFRRLAVAA